MRCLRGYSYLDFYCELWCAGLRILQKTEYQTNDWYKCKHFLLVKVNHRYDHFAVLILLKIPLLLTKWKTGFYPEVDNRVTNLINPPNPSATNPANPPTSNSVSPVDPIQPPPSATGTTTAGYSFNDVELSVSYLSNFPFLIEKQHKNGTFALV